MWSFFQCHVCSLGSKIVLSLKRAFSSSSSRSSPADVPVPTQMASPTSDGEEDEEVRGQRVAETHQSCGAVFFESHY